MCSRIIARYCSRERIRHDRQLFAALQIFEARRLGEREVHLGGIEHVEEDDVVAAEPDQPERVENFLGSS